MGHVLQYFKALFLARGLRPVVLAACLVAGCGASTESRVELRLGDGNTTSPTNWEGSWVPLGPGNAVVCAPTSGARC